MFVFVILSLFLIVLIRSLYKNHYQYWTKRGFVSDGANFPLDSLMGAGTRAHTAEIFDENYQRFKGQPFAGLFFMFTPAIAIYDPDLIQSILVKDFSHFNARYLYYNEETDPLSANLLTIEGQKWRDRRSKLTPIFTSGKIKMMFGIIEEIAEKLVDKVGIEVKKSSSLEISEWLARFTTDAIGEYSMIHFTSLRFTTKLNFKKEISLSVWIAIALKILTQNFVAMEKQFSKLIPPQVP